MESTGRPARARIEVPALGRAIVADFGASQIRTFRVPVDGGDVREVDLIEWDLAEGPHGAFEESPVPASPTGRRDTEPDRDSSDTTLPAERMAPSQRRREG